ncbi:lysylphosphatidylglycerol synthase transmembrane domain-containing protein [Azospirillum sp. ST 5-10]|uniref:lysylphosphatidylglycerol synthase transmembrane domain-containing protein n=1 Tax=unclassified Azospirillum TaxID=2630922 RepID=UPI003F4A0AE0
MPAFSRAALTRAEHLTVATVAVSVAAFALAGVLAGWDEVVGPVSRLDPAVVGGMLGLSLVNYALRTLRWRLFEERLGIHVPPVRTALYFAAGFALTATPGKIGEALRLWLLEKRHGVPYTRSAPLLIGDRVADANSVAALCLVGFAVFADQAWIGAVLLAGLVAGNAALMRPAALEALVGVAFRLLGRRGARLFAGARTALRRNVRLFAPRLFLTTLVLGCLGWLAESLAFHWLLTAFGTGTTLAESVFIFAFSMLVGAVSMLPGGLGGTEATMVALLVATGTDPATALAATAVIRLTTLWFAVVVGFAALPFALRGTARRSVPA